MKNIVFRPLPQGFKEPLGIKVYVIDRGEHTVVRWFCEHSSDRYDLTPEGLDIFCEHMLNALKKWRGGLEIISTEVNEDKSIFNERKTIWPVLVVVETFQKLTRLIESRSQDAYRPPADLPRHESY